MPRRRTAKGERKIDKSQKGRVYWRPGEAHPLDVLGEELKELSARLPDQLQQLLVSAQQAEEHLRAILEATHDLEDPTSIFTPAEQAAHTAILQRFGNRKHLEHLLMIFTLQRRKRMLGRLQAAAAALDLANGLLSEEESFSPEIGVAWRLPANQDQEENQMEEPSSEPASPLTKEELRVQGLDEPLTQIISSVEQSRRLLRDFETQLPELRRQLASGQGWFEVFSVPKRHFKQKVVDYAKALQASRKHHTPIPEAIQQAIHPDVAGLIQAGASSFPTTLRDEVYDIVYVGPYVKYRWTEQKRTYSISLGLRDDYPPFPFVPEGF